MRLTAYPDSKVYKSGDVMQVTVILDYTTPPVEGYIEIHGGGMRWRTNPIRDLQRPLTVVVPVQIPYCTVVEGTTITGYKVPCPTNAVPVSGPVTFTVEFKSLDGATLARTSFTVTIKGPAEQLSPPGEEEKGIPWWLIAGGALILFGGD